MTFNLPWLALHHFHQNPSRLIETPVQSQFQKTPPEPTPEPPLSPRFLPSLSDSLLTNGDFESALSGWSNISSAGGNAETIPGGTREVYYG